MNKTLIIIRHAIAEDRFDYARSGAPDTDRPLTDKGRERMVAACGGLRRVLPAIGTLATSPWIRARQTADIVSRAYGGLAVVETDAMIPGHGPDSLMSWLSLRWHNGPVAVVGHEPHLGGLIGWALHGPFGVPLPMKKGSACALVFNGEAGPGTARLDWFMSPKALRTLGKKRHGANQY